MRNRIIGGGILVGVIAIIICCLVMPGSDTQVAKDESLAGGNITIEAHAGTVSDSAVSATTVEPIVPETTSPSPEPTDDNNGHVKLNLNYSRLGIANKVDTYLNVRKKPSEKSKVVGKLTKNAGCHVYYIKKGWAKIVSGKVKGFVRTKFMVFDKKAEALATKVGKTVAVIDTPALKVRELPSTKAHIYSVVAEGEEFEIRKEKITKSFLEKIIKKNKISSKRVEKCGGVDALCETLDNWICIKVDDEYAFVSNEFITSQYTLKRAVKIGELQAGTGVTSSQANVVEFAKQFLGNPYVWGGTSLTHGTDCSGFVLSIYAHFGYGLPRTAASQCAATRTVKSPVPGDLFFYSNGSRVNHVAMYIGSGMVIHASNPSDGIKISNAYYRSPVKIGRVMN